MKPSAFQETTENQFDYICKKVIEDERKDYYKQLARLSKKKSPSLKLKIMYSTN